MKNRLLFSLLILFVVYLISQDATATGSTANEFFSWVDGGVDTAREFMDALFEDNNAASVPATATN